MSALLSALEPIAKTPSDELDDLIARQLTPRVCAIDLEGEYPEAFLRALGALGGFSGVVSTTHGGSGKGLADTVKVMTRVGEICLSTAFAVWCQTACARYIQLSDNAALHSELLPALANASFIASTSSIAIPWSALP